MQKRRINKILLLYKTSAFQYFQNRRYFPKYLNENSCISRRFKQTHDKHYSALDKIEETLKSRKIQYQKIKRRHSVDFSKYDLVITLGGDGTFLEAARNIKNQLILGVNSDPQWSIGQFCIDTIDTFPKTLDKILNNKCKVQPVSRLRVRLNGRIYPANILNDILICHKNPAAMSHYYLTIRGYREEQRSSGIWIATSAGSTGAIHSAGGKILPLKSDKFQYMPRELCKKTGKPCRFSGGVICGTQILTFTSLMNSGMIYLDGAHVKIPFPFGTKLSIAKSPYPLRMIRL